MERTFLKSENELLVSVENIARKISGLEPKVSSKPQPKTPDFSANEKVATKKVTNKKSKSTRNNLEPTLTESEKRFIRKFYRVKLGINPNNILTWWQEKRVKEKIADYQKRGRSLLFGGIGGCLGALSGAPTIVLGSYFPFLYAVFGIVVGVSFVACTIVALCSIPYYVYVSKIKKTFYYIQNNSLKGSNFASTGNEKKGFDVALLSCSF